MSAIYDQDILRPPPIQIAPYGGRAESYVFGQNQLARSGSCEAFLRQPPHEANPLNNQTPMPNGPIPSGHLKMGVSSEKCYTCYYGKRPECSNSNVKDCQSLVQIKREYTCSKCRTVGHTMRSCPLWCRKCKKPGHGAGSCPD